MCVFQEQCLQVFMLSHWMITVVDQQGFQGGSIY